MKCQFCRKCEGVIPITDGETLQQLWICESCDSQLVWEPDTSYSQGARRPKRTPDARAGVGKPRRRSYATHEIVCRCAPVKSKSRLKVGSAEKHERHDENAMPVVPAVTQTLKGGAQKHDGTNNRTNPTCSREIHKSR